MKDSRVLSSGTTAAADKERNLPYYRMTLDLLEKHGIRGFAKSGYGDQLTQSRLEEADITVCMNQRVYDECLVTRRAVSWSGRVLCSPLLRAPRSSPTSRSST
jgi:hypothetical protein